MKKKLSIIVPIYNCEKYIERAITSLINQKYKNIEILLINDGSTDNSKLICEKIAETDERIVLFDKVNSGVSSTRNFGIEHATGDYITFIDGDDYIENDAYSYCMKIIDSNDIDFFKFSYIKESKNNKLANMYKMPTDIVVDISDKTKYSKEIFFSKDFEGIWDLIVKKDLLKTNNICFDTSLKFSEDFKFACSCFSKSKKAYFTNQSFYHYVINENSVTQKYELNKQILWCDNIIKSYMDSSDILGIAINSNNYCIKKVFNLIYITLGNISINENKSDFYTAVEKINNLNNFVILCKKCNLDKLSTSYFFYEKLKIKGKVRRFVKNIVYR